MEGDRENIEQEQKNELTKIRAEIKAAREEKAILDKELSQETPKKFQDSQNESFITEAQTTPSK